MDKTQKFLIAYKEVCEFRLKILKKTQNLDPNLKAFKKQAIVWTKETIDFINTLQDKSERSTHEDKSIPEKRKDK